MWLFNMVLTSSKKAVLPQGLYQDISFTPAKLAMSVCDIAVFLAVRSLSQQVRFIVDIPREEALYTLVLL